MQGVLGDIKTKVGAGRASETCLTRMAQVWSVMGRARRRRRRRARARRRRQRQDSILRLQRSESQGLGAQAANVVEEGFDLFLEARDGAVHLLELFRVLEVVGAAVGRVEALEVEVAASLTGRLAIALDLAALALITATER